VTEAAIAAVPTPDVAGGPAGPMRRFLRRSMKLFAAGVIAGALVAGGALAFDLLPPLPTFSPETLSRLQKTLDGLDREALMEVLGSTGPFAGVLRSPWTLFLHNGGVAAVLVLGGLTFGVVTGLVLVVNGFAVGALLVLAFAIRLPPLVILATVIPHGVFELAGFWLAGALGFALGDALRRRRRRELQIVNLRAWTTTLAAVAILLLIAAFFELYVTPEAARWALRNW
jgi:uncharacterized membrane protein SpoIIM required for sporulation